jgi:crossover junction endodeoxyribonuclease RuvC
MTITIGIDPGLNGAIAAVKDGRQLVYYCDMPTLTETKPGGKAKRTVSGAGVAQALNDIIALCPGEYFSVMLEQVSAMPGQGVTSMFSLGHSLGVVEGVVLAKGIPLHRYRPALWKKKMGYTSDKETIRADMVRMFPSAELHRKKDADRAEAIAMAIFLHKEEFA